MLQPSAPSDASSVAVPEEPELAMRSATMVTEARTAEEGSKRELVEEMSPGGPDVGDSLQTESPAKSGGRKGRRRKDTGVPAAEKTRRPGWFVRLFHWGQ
jgi:hypothetical protein